MNILHSFNSLADNTVHSVPHKTVTKHKQAKRQTSQVFLGIDTYGMG